MRHVILAALFCLTMARAQAAEITVLTTGAYKPVLETLARRFEAATGHRVILRNDTAGAVQRRVAAGEGFDVLVLTPAGLRALAPRLSPEPPRELARVGIGVAVRQGAPMPDISTPEAFQQALLSARSVAMIDPAAGGSSGIYLAGLFERWGIARQIAGKAVLVPGGLVATRLLDGQADIAIHQISEILAVPGVALVGPLPDAIQNWTVYAGSLAAAPQDPAAARAFLDSLRGPEAAQVIEAAGMRAP
jgi:molybdate transport system substrate-binding protein